MRLLSLCVCIVAGCSSTDDEKTTDDTSTSSTMSSDRWDASLWPETIGGDRPAPVATPSNWDGTSELPGVIVLHGYGMREKNKNNVKNGYVEKPFKYSEKWG